ncbi:MULTISPECIES: amidohydrolase [Paenarthrobacter]|uniref:amidohydrolase n=1 Tax=Paenarthrobacter TaxID=1742992 RepID=UPI00223011FA|nr:amidohydrolase [Paenarthrobacter sp. PAE-2]MCW3767343.1 amidohydrolase [Paenarthrobacter sp. PAE-2]
MNTEASVDTIVLSKTILAGETLQELDGFLAIHKGVIIASGTAEQAQNWVPRAEHVIDVGSATVAPGLIDAHIHPILGLSMARGLDLSGITEPDAVQKALAQHIIDTPHVPGSDWLFAWGLDPAVFGDSESSNRLFDDVFENELVYITLFDGHAALVSDAGLREAGVTGKEELPSSAYVALDAEGKPNGMLYEMAAMELVQRILPQLTFDERVDALDALLQSMAETGLVGGQMLDFGREDSLDVLDALEKRGDLAIRLRVSPWVMPGATQEELEAKLALQSRRGRRWHVHGIKLMIDGTIDNGTAWLFAPDTHGESLRPLWRDPENMVAALRFFHEHHVPTATHAIGDQAVSFVAKAIGALSENGIKHRIEHIESIPDSVLEEVVEAGATTSLQPTHCTLYCKADQSDNWSRRLGPERANLAWRTSDLRKAGAVVALGSDWPIAPYDPRGIIAAAQTRRPAGRPDITPVGPAQALSAKAALEGYTSQYWKSVGESGGVLKVGARADLSIFDCNPLTTAPDDFANAHVVMTMLDGEVVVDRQSVTAPATH